MFVNVPGQNTLSPLDEHNHADALQAERKTQQKSSRRNLIKENHRKILQRTKHPYCFIRASFPWPLHPGRASKAGTNQLTLVISWCVAPFQAPGDLQSPREVVSFPNG